MKKLVSLIFAITLLTSVNIHARAIDSDVVPSQDDSNVTTIRKATMATYEQSFTWDEFTTIGNPNGGSNWTECDMQFYRNGNTSSRPHLRLCFCVKDDGARTYYSSSGTAYYFPQNGTYTIGTSLTLFTVGAYNNSWSYNWDSQFWPDNTKTYWLKSGTVTVSDGHRRNEEEPYIVVNSTANVNENGYTVSQGTYISARFTIGEPLYTYNINVATNNASWGTVSKSTSSVTEGGSVTLTATETNGTFLGWSLDGGYNIIAGTSNRPTYSVTLDADAGYNGQTFTYTAVFEDAGTTQYTISTAVTPAGYGTVSGSGDYYEGREATLTATSANEHVYIFDHWLKDGNNYAGGATITPTVTAAATYTAVFRAAAAGTITGYANPLYGSATISPSGNQAGGTAVTLTVTPNSGYMFVQWEDGNTDNPRTVYVDGDATYTAQFAVETPLCGAVKYNTANHEIDWGKHGDQDWNDSYMTWNSANDMFVRVRASDYTDDSMNHIQLCFWVNDFSVTYNGTIGPKAGTYTVVQPYVAGWNTGNNYWDLDASYLNNAVVGSDPNYVIGAWREDLAMIWTTSHSPYCAYVADKGPWPDSPENFVGIPIGSTVTVSKGEGGYCYVEVRNANGRLLFTIGEKAASHTLGWEANGGTLTGGTAAGSVDEGATITAPTATRTGYTFTGWSPAFSGTMPSTNVTYTAQWTPTNYTITYNDLNGATNNNPTSYNIETETITLQDPGTRDDYIFAGWKDESDNTITQIAQGSTGNRTLTATWNAKSSNIVLCEDCNNAHYNTFKANYNNETVNVTYNRQFTASRWSTMCLPFSLDLATMIANKMYGRVYEFKYATGNANVGSGVNLYFSNAKSIEAGKCYIVNANAELAAKTSFVFSGVTIDVSADKGEALNTVAAYNRLDGYKSQGTIELVGTLRNGTLQGSATGNKYMGLKENKIYYPNTDTGSTIWAYRGIFRSTSALNVEKMRIIVDGEDRGELLIDADGELLNASGDAPSRKFIRDGVLYIEREGVIYDAQGKRIE